MIEESGEQFYAAASIASRAPVQDCPPACRSGPATTMPRVLVACDSAANRCTSFIAAQTTAGGDTGVASSITLPCATSS
jgi:hypothetical protein